MVFNILSVVAFVLSSLCAMFLGACGYGLWRSKRDQRECLEKLKKNLGDFSQFGGS